MHTTTGPSTHVFHALQQLSHVELAALVDGRDLGLQRARALAKLADAQVTHTEALEALVSVHFELEGLRARMSPGAYDEMIMAMAQLYDEARGVEGPPCPD